MVEETGSRSAAARSHFLLVPKMVPGCDNIHACGVNLGRFQRDADPPAEFSPFAMARVTWCSRLSLGKSSWTALLPGSPTISPIKE